LIESIHVSFPHSRDGGRLRQDGFAGNDALCSAFNAAVKTELSDKKEEPELHADGAHGETEVLTRRSYLTRHAVTAAVMTELSDEKDQPESHADGEHGETELPDEKELPESHADEVHGETELPYETELNMRCSGSPNTRCSSDLPTISSGGV